MIFRELLDFGSKERRKRDRKKTAQKFAVGMGVVATLGVATGIILAPKSGKETREDMKKNAVNTVETIKETVQKKVEMVKDSAANAAQNVGNAIKDVQEKTEDVKKDIKDGYHEVTQNIHKTAEKNMDIAQKKVELVKDSVAHTAHEVSHAIKDAQGKADEVKKDFKSGYHEVTQDIHKTAENISKELK